MGTQCPTVVPSFPPGMSVASFEEYNSYPLNNLSFEFAWGVRQTAPGFITPESGEINEVDMAVSTSADTDNTSVLYSIGADRRRYYLESVQLTKPTHLTWLAVSSNRILNQEDVIITYSPSNLEPSPGSMFPDKLIFIIPIIRGTVATNDPAYFVSMANPTQSISTPISIRSVFPQRENEIYMYYKYQRAGTPGSSIAQKINQVIVNVTGLNVSATTMSKIKTLYNNISVDPDYKPYRYENDFLDQSTTNPYVISQACKNSLVKRSQRFLTAVVKADTESPLKTEPTTISTDALKCVPLDPDKHIRDGTIVINPETGVPLTEEERKRQELLTLETKTTTSADVGALTTYISTVMGIIFGGILLLTLVYAFLSFFVGADSTGGAGATGFRRLALKAKEISPFAIVGILAGLLGLLMGILFKIQMPAT